VRGSASSEYSDLDAFPEMGLGAGNDGSENSPSMRDSRNSSVTRSVSVSLYVITKVITVAAFVAATEGAGGETRERVRSAASESHDGFTQPSRHRITYPLD
jgi:hypothetical protein